MKKFFGSLMFKLLFGIFLGSIVGIICHNYVEQTETLMQVIVCFHRLMGQFVSFCVPLIVLGFVCPSITKMGEGAGRMLGVALILAYSSSICAALLSAVAGYIIVPMMNIARPSDALAIPKAIFQLDIPQVMPVITALFISITVGLTAVWTNAKVIKDVLAEFQLIVLSIVNKMLIPLLPFFVGTTFVTLGFDGTLSQFPVFLIAIVIVVIGHYIWLTVLYLLAGVYSGKNPMEVLKHYLPAYTTAIGTMSSAATLSVALECANKSKVLRKDVISFGVPLFANIHLCGSVLTEVFFCMIISKIAYGVLPDMGTMIIFIMLLGIFAVGAPGVPGGTVVASLGIVISVLGFDEIGTGMLVAIFALQDSFGTACNITGDGALTLFLTGYSERHNLAKV